MALLLAIVVKPPAAVRPAQLPETGDAALVSADQGSSCACHSKEQLSRCGTVVESLSKLQWMLMFQKALLLNVHMLDQGFLSVSDTGTPGL